MVEIMVAAGLLAGLALAGMQLFKNQNSAQRNVEANYEIASLVNQVRAILSNPRSCAATFNVPPYYTPDGNVGPTFLRKENNSGGFDFPILQTGVTQPGNIKIVSYRLRKPSASAGYASNETQLLLEFSKGKAAIRDQSNKVIKIIYTTNASNQIISCYAYNTQSDSLWQISTTNANDIYRMGGNVGIGTASPSSNLDIFGSSGIVSTSIKTPGTSAGQQSVLFLEGKTGATDADRRIWHWAARGNAYGGGEENQLVAGYWNGTSWSTPMRFTPNGKVIVGNSLGFNNATMEVHTNVPEIGGLVVRGNQTAGATHWVGIMANLNGGSWNPGTLAGDMGIIFGGGWTDLGKGLVIGPWSVGNRGLRIDAGGNVSIGESFPNPMTAPRFAVRGGGAYFTMSREPDGSVIRGNSQGSNILSALSLEADGNYWQVRANVPFWGSSFSLCSSNYVGACTTWMYMLPSNGAVTFVGPMTAQSYAASSDRSLKEDIKTLENPLEKIMKMRGVSFTWKKTKEKDIGFIAQEVEKVEPRLVSIGDKGLKTLKYSNVVALVLEALKELKGIVSELVMDQKSVKQELELMKAELEKLRKENEKIKKELSSKR